MLIRINERTIINTQHFTTLQIMESSSAAYAKISFIGEAHVSLNKDEYDFIVSVMHTRKKPQKETGEEVYD